MRTNEGHRQRVKARFLKEGLQNFEESHALELLLFYAIPRKDTKPIARRLLDRFGSFAAVLGADMDALQKVEGVGPATAAYIHTIHEVGRYYQVSQAQNQQKLVDLNRCGEYLAPFFHGATREMVYLLCLDAKSCAICCREISSGDVASSPLSTRRVVQSAIDAGAVSVVLAHNHPGGISKPSEEDLVVTKLVGATLASVGVLMVDHVIFADGDFISLAQSGHYVPNDYSLALL